jgi:hypothetical protein
VPEVGQGGECTRASRSRSRSTKYVECTPSLYVDVVVTLRAIARTGRIAGTATTHRATQLGRKLGG